VSAHLTAAREPAPVDVTTELARLLDQVADRIAECGTGSERSALHALADVTRWLAPGASAALVDWDGPETSRLRAYGVLHGVALRALDRDDHAWLVGRIEGTSAVELDARVA
jgi:hypothetical protein